jgi:pimeloyl-ACP methyl ester carboxylesterase
MKYENKVEVNGTKLNVYTEGSGKVTIVFMAGNGVTCPVLEYRPLYRRMAEKYRVVVIEKAGYGFSEGMKSQRLLEKLVFEDREALKMAGIEPPYVLAPHSYSGFEAIYWANTYPKEVEAILSIDMGIPETAIQQSKEITELKRLKMLDKQFKLLQTISKDGLFAKIAKKKTIPNAARKKKIYIATNTPGNNVLKVSLAPDDNALSIKSTQRQHRNIISASLNILPHQ